MIFGKDFQSKICVLVFSAISSVVFLIIRRIERYIIINAHRSSVKYPLFLSGFNETWTFRQIFRTKWDIKFHENPSSGNRVVSCGRTDGQKDMTKLIVIFVILRKTTKNQTGVQYLSGDIYCMVCRRLIVQTLVFSLSYLHRQVLPPETLVVNRWTTWARNGSWIFPENVRLPRNIQGSFTCRKSTTWENGFASLPKEGVLRIFFTLKSPTALAGFEPANLGTKGQHATSRPPKPLK